PADGEHTLVRRARDDGALVAIPSVTRTVLVNVQVDPGSAEKPDGVDGLDKRVRHLAAQDVVAREVALPGIDRRGAHNPRVQAGQQVRLRIDEADAPGSLERRADEAHIARVRLARVA